MWDRMQVLMIIFYAVEKGNVKIIITISSVISASFLQYYFEILKVLDNYITFSSLLKDPKHKKDEKFYYHKNCLYRPPSKVQLL